MPKERYRVTNPTIAVFEENGRNVAHHVPAGALVIADQPAEGDKLMNVVWDNKQIMMFAQDLRTRAEPVRTLRKTATS